MSDGAVSFETEHFSVYAVTRAANQYSVTSPTHKLSTTETTYSASGYEVFCAFNTKVLSGNYTNNLHVKIETTSNVDLSKAIVREFRYDWNHDKLITSTNTTKSIEFTVEQWEIEQCSFAVLLPPKSIDSMVLTGLSAGTYTLEETEAPAGYQLAQP